MLFICTYSLLVSIFENVGLASFPSVIAFLASSKERNCHTVIGKLFANSFANFNLSNKPFIKLF